MGAIRAQLTGRKRRSAGGGSRTRRTSRARRPAMSGASRRLSGGAGAGAARRRSRAGDDEEEEEEEEEEGARSTRRAPPQRRVAVRFSHPRRSISLSLSLSFFPPVLGKPRLTPLIEARAHSAPPRAGALLPCAMSACPTRPAVCAARGRGRLGRRHGGLHRRRRGGRRRGRRRRRRRRRAVGHVGRTPGLSRVVSLSLFTLPAPCAHTGTGDWARPAAGGRPPTEAPARPRGTVSSALCAAASASEFRPHAARRASKRSLCAAGRDDW